MGLKQRTLAALCGHREEWVCRHIREPRPPMALRLAIAAWALLSERQRSELVAGLGLKLGRQRLVAPHETALYSADLAVPARTSPHSDRDRML